MDRRIGLRVGQGCCTGVEAESQTITYKQHVAADVELTGEACSGCWDDEMLGIYHNIADGCL